MSKYQGGMIGSVNSTSGTDYTGKANGIFPLPQQIVNKQLSLWARGQTRPNPPTIGTATATGATTISVAFIPPVQNGGSAITSYTVTSSGGQTATGSSSPIVVSGLTSTTYYTFTVTATNALGTSDSSGTSNSVIPALTDPYYSSVVLLLNGDTLTDLSNSPKAITNRGSVTVNTSTKKYGTGSMYFSSTSTSAGESSMLSTTGLSALNIATGDFTIEMWFYATSLQNYSRLFNINTTWGPDAVCINWNSSSSNMVFSIYNYANPLLSTSSPPSMNTWNHIAVTRSGSTFYLFLNGVLQQSATWAGSMYNTATPYFTIGNGDANVGGYSPFTGYIDDLRVTKGVARYTANFTPPTAPLPTL